MTFKRVVVTGVVALTPIEYTREEYWDELLRHENLTEDLLC